MWWDGDDDEKYWVEIRRQEGIGHSLWCPTADERGRSNPWYELVRRVRKGDVVYHYNARESRFVGRSVAATDARVDSSAPERGYTAKLRDFTPIPSTVDLATLRANAYYIYDLRDRLEAAHGSPIFLPFQFTQDRGQFRMLSNYFAKLPAELVTTLFGPEGLAEGSSPSLPVLPGEDGDPSPELEVPAPIGGFLQPFKPKADTDYLTRIVGGVHRRTREHEALVNACALWLDRRGLVSGRNAAVDLGIENPEVIIEAKTIGGGWATCIREAVGQLYEYRYFGICSPQTSLIFLAPEDVPERWVRYLEKDRGIGVLSRSGRTFKASKLASRMLNFD